MKTMAEVLGEHNISSLIEGGWYCFNCDSTFGEYRDANAHQADALTAAGFGLVKAAAADAWAEGHESGFWNGRESAGHHEMRYVGLEHAQLNNPYRAATIEADQ